MYRFKHRLAQLERRTGASQKMLLFLMDRIDRAVRLDSATIIAVLRECGYLPGPGLSAFLNFIGIPDELSPKDLEQYVRTHAGAICRSGGRDSSERTS